MNARTRGGRPGDMRAVIGIGARIHRNAQDRLENMMCIAKQALERIAALYKIEASIRGDPPDRRRSRASRPWPVPFAMA